MGVHITFVRSTNLDSWNWPQLRAMKVGGNGAATAFFNSRRAGDLLRPGVEGKVKYNSAVAAAYKEELDRRTAADAAASGVPVDSPVYFPGLAIGAGGSASPPLKAAADEDFFDDWDNDKPRATTPQMEKPPPTQSAVPGIGVLRPTPATQAARVFTSSGSASPASSQMTSVPSSSTSTSGNVTPASRTSTPSAIIPAARAPARRALGASRLGTTSSGSVAGRAGKLGGIKKAGTFDFAAVERKAAEAAKVQEEEKKRQAEAAAAAEAAAFTAASTAAQDAEKHQADQQAEEAARMAIKAALNKQAVVPSTAGVGSATRSKPTGQIDRLGMGMGRLGIKAERLRSQQAAETSASRAVASKAEEEMPDFARRKFGDQKAISSDMYFERGNYDSQASAEAQERLSKFSGATAISSNAYFGRDEPDPDDPDAEFEDEWHSVDNGWSNGDFGELEATAKDYYHRFMNNPDVQSGLDSLRTGAMKLSQLLEDAARNGS